MYVIICKYLKIVLRFAKDIIHYGFCNRTLNLNQEFFTGLEDIIYLVF